MNFGALKTRIESVLGRVPSELVYELVTSDVNNAVRVRSLEKSARRIESDRISLPDDIKAIKSIRRGDVELSPVSLTSTVFETEGTPMSYAISEGVLHLAPKSGNAVFYQGEISPALDGFATYGVSAPQGQRVNQYGTFGAFHAKVPSDVFRLQAVDNPVKSVSVTSTSDLGGSVYVDGFASTQLAGGPIELPFETVNGPGDYVYSISGGTGSAALTLTNFLKTASTNALSGKRTAISITAGNSAGWDQGDIEIYYYERLGNLSADTDTNDILTTYPQIYVYGALFHHHSLTQNAEAAQGYYQLYERAMNEAKKENNAALFGKGPIVPKVRSTP